MHRPLAATLLLAVLLPAISPAQTPAGDDFSAVEVNTGGVAGRVLDAATDFPLAGVQVRVVNEAANLTVISVTDDFGTYLVDGLIPADHFEEQLRSARAAKPASAVGAGIEPRQCIVTRNVHIGAQRCCRRLVVTSLLAAYLAMTCNDRPERRTDGKPYPAA